MKNNENTALVNAINNKTISSRKLKVLPTLLRNVKRKLRIKNS